MLNLSNWEFYSIGKSLKVREADRATEQQTEQRTKQKTKQKTKQQSEQQTKKQTEKQSDKLKLFSQSLESKQMANLWLLAR